MTVSNTTSVVQYNGNGVTVAWPTGYRFFNNTDLVVMKRSVAGTTTVLTLNVDYSVSGANNLAGGTVTTTAPLLGGGTPELLTIARVLTVQQLTDLRNQGDYFAEIHEDVFDYLTMLIQQTAESDSRALRHPRDSEHYQAEARRIVNLEDPVDDQDATTKRWSREYLTSLISAIQGPINNALNIFFKGPDNLDYVVQDLANVSTLAKGAALIGYRGRTVKAKLDESATVDDYKLPGMTDIQAIEAMLAATGGTARLLPDRVYNLHNWTYSVATGAINIIGAGKPSSDIGYTTLSEKGASVISGHVEIRAPVVNIRDFGVDCGTARGYAHGTGCLTVDAPLGAAGISFTSKNIAIMGADTTAASVSHGFLVEGFDRNLIENTDCYKLWYGIILKGRRGFVGNTRAWMISGAPIFIKSDLPASGGNVLDATANNVTVDGVISETYLANTTCNHVYVMASTAVLSTVKVRNVSGTFGNTAVTVAGGGALLYCAGVELSDIKAIGCYIGVETFGTTYDVKMTGVIAENPKSGLVIKTSGASSRWKVGEWSALLTDPALAAITYIATFGGTGSWDSCDCRSGVGTKRIPFLPDTVICGKRAGEVVIDGEGPLSLGGNWSAAAGDAPSLVIYPGNLMKLSGRFQNTVATGTSMAAVAGGVRTGTNPDFICAGFAGGTTPNAVIIRWSSAGLTLMSPALGSFGAGSIVSIDQMTLQR